MVSWLNSYRFRCRWKLSVLFHVLSEYVIELVKHYPIIYL